MRVTPWMPIAVAVFALAPSVALAQKVTYDYDHTQDFSRLKTFAFRENSTSDKSDNPLLDERITAAVAAQLAARGMTRDEARPDIYVTVRQTFETEKRYTVYNTGYGPYVWNMDTSANYSTDGWTPGWPTKVQVKDIVTETLTIDLVDAATNRLAWRGLGRMTVHPFSTPTHVSRRIDHEVKEIFENLPTKRRGPYWGTQVR